MISFLHLKARSIGAGALLLLAACLVVTFTFTQTPAETRSRSGAVSSPPAATSQSSRDWAPYDVPGDATPWRDGGLRQTVDRPAAAPANAGSGISVDSVTASVDTVTAPAAKFVSSALRPITFSLLIAKPGELLKSAIKVMHLLGIILGLGAATVLDLVIVKFLISGKIKADQVAMVKFMTGIVSAGLAVLWISGILYLTHYAVFDPVKLWNEKVWAKIAIVGVLTINGYFIHHTVLPLMEKQVGRSLFAGLTRKQIAMMMTFGTVSATSWYVPLILGAMPHFNFIVPAPRLLVAYALILLIAIAATHGMVDTIRRRGGLQPRLQPAI
ncbi:hypothetical protein FG93_03912 [Bosea sp. LC85]|nr:hypothetical protein FG93_03912 [Bosea sp. LC85]